MQIIHRFSRLAACGLALLPLLSSAPARAQYSWTTLAGNIGGVGYSDGTGPGAHFNNLNGIAVDAAGNLYVADTSNHTIRKVTTGGVVTTLAGSPGQSGSTDGTGSAARFNQPLGVAVDSGNNVYVGDWGNHTIRKITPAGLVSTIAGSAGNSGYLDATGAAARFTNPWGVAVDGNGFVYVADNGNATIRKITPGGVVSTLAGSPTSSGDGDGTGSGASIHNPTGITVDLNGVVYVTTYLRDTIRKITAGGVVTTLAGTPGISSSTDATGAAAGFYSPTGLTVDATGNNLYVADYNNNTIRQVTTAQGVVTTLAGLGFYKTIVSYGSTDGTGSTARFSGPGAIAMDSNGDLFVADQGNNAVRKVTLAGVVTTFAGSARVIGSADGTGSAAGFKGPSGVAFDGLGNTFVADTLNHTIRKVTPAGVTTTVAGTVGATGSLDGQGTAASFNRPNGVASFGDGTLVVADTYNHTIRMITPGGLVSTLAGKAGFTGSTDATGTSARFNYPTGVALDKFGNIYVADQVNFTIRKVTLAGVVTTLAGTTGAYGSADGSLGVARFQQPTGLTVDSFGNVYVADKLNNTIRKVTPLGLVSTIAGSASAGAGSADGQGTAARFNNPTGVAVDGAGNLYVADSLNETIRQISPTWAVTTIGGLAGDSTIGDGLGSAARFNNPVGIAVNTLATKLVAADSGNYRIVAAADLTTQPPVLISPPSNSATGDAIAIAFTLPEPALPGSVSVTFAGTSTYTYNLDSSVEGAGTSGFYISASDPYAASEVINFSGIAGLPDGTYTVTISYQDASGNPAATAVSTHVVVDTVAPVLTPPSDIIASATSLSGTPVPYPAATVVDAGGGVTLTYTKNSGTIFPIGTTTVTATATDAAGNSASADFHVTVRFSADTADIKVPTVTIRAPAANGNVPEGSSSSVTGTAADDKHVLGVQMRLNNGPWTDAITTLATGGKTATYALPLLPLGPIAGVNVLAVRSLDLWGNVSTAVNRTFTYVVLRPLTMPFDPLGGRVTIAPLKPLTLLQLGTTYTLTATPNTHYIWDYWSATPTGVTHALGTRFSFIMTEGLTIYPHFIFNPYPTLVGSYNGLVSPTNSTPDVQGNNGLFHATVSSTGMCTGTLSMGAVVTSFTGLFDPQTGAATVGNSTTPYLFSLVLDLSGATRKITGNITRQVVGVGGATFATSADLAYYSTTNKPTALLNTAGTGPGVYTVALPARTTQTGLTSTQYPQGSGIGTVTVQTSGVVSLVGTLADGGTITASLPLSKSLAWPLYAVLSNHYGLVTGMVQFDTGATDSDLTATGLQWFRPATASLYYKAGWTGSILVDLIGAKFAAPVAGSAELPGLPAVDVTNGNATLTLSHGKLVSDITKNVNISTLSKVTPAPLGDTSYAVTLTTTSGAIAGSFTSGDHKPTIKGITLQKGANRGGYGFFLTTVPVYPGNPGESGCFSLFGK